MSWLSISGIMLVVLISLVLALRHLSRVAGERDWVYNKHNPRPRGGGTLGLLEEIYQPSIQHVIEERSSQRARGSQDESGENPTPGRDPNGEHQQPRRDD